MPLPAPAPSNDATLALHADWLARFPKRTPPPGRAACEASVRAAERVLLGGRRAAIG